MRKQRKFATKNTQLCVQAYNAIPPMWAAWPGGAVVPSAAGTRLDSTPLMVLVWFGACSLVVGSARAQAFPHLQRAHFEAAHMWPSGTSHCHKQFSAISEEMFCLNLLHPFAICSLLFSPFSWQATDESLSTDAIEKIMLHLFILPYLLYKTKNKISKKKIIK